MSVYDGVPTDEELEQAFRSPRNTTREVSDEGGGLLIILESMAGGHPIEAMERQGQREIVSSEVLPNPDQQYSRVRRADFEALGVTFGDAVPGDPLFVRATLPAGWTRRGSDHDMWSYVLDERGEERIAVFYKAAFYDRSASMNVVALCSDCDHSLNAHPYAGRAVEASALNDWTSVDAPTPCLREGCPCVDFAREQA